MEKPLSLCENIPKEGVGLVRDIPKLIKEYLLEMGCAFKDREGVGLVGDITKLLK